MKIRNLLGLATIGGLVYLHRKRGGEFTIESFRDSARQLWDGILRAAEQARKDTDKQVRDSAKEVGRVAEDLGKRAQDFGERAQDFSKGAGGSSDNGRR